jgi:hypothetical protein
MKTRLAMIGMAALLLAGSAARGDFVPNNFWPNAAFESGVNLDQPDATLTGWSRGGSDPTVCQVTTNNCLSPGHALAVLDQDGSGYGEWYSDLLNLTGRANPGDAITVQWSELFSIVDGEMRVTVGFFTASDMFLSETHFVVNGQSAGWQGSIEASTFTQRAQALAVPAGAAKLRVSLVSGGSEATLGEMVVDDLSVGPLPHARLLAGNIWPNATFETGDLLDTTNGIPAGWNRGGNQSTICQVVTNNFVSASHALAVVDASASGYGEWYSDFHLAGHANPGDTLNLQWFELYSITNGEMRVTALFSDSAGVELQAHSYTATGRSGGWSGAVGGSAFSIRRTQLIIPPEAVGLRIALVSGGPETTTGVMLIDDLSVARHPVPPTVLAGNFFPNPTFEEGAQLDHPTLALPAGGWQRGGNDPSIGQVITNSSVSPIHSLALHDNNGSGYGEWYLFLSLSGLVPGEDVLDVQWYEIYSIPEGSMRLSFAFLDATDGLLAHQDFDMSGQSPGWAGNLSDSPFARRLERLTVPPDAARLRVNFASGGAESATGTVVMDDLAVRISRPWITAVALDANGVNLVWNSVPGANYTVLFADSLSGTPAWTSLATALPSDGLSTSYIDAAVHSGSQGFYRIQQE